MNRQIMTAKDSAVYRDDRDALAQRVADLEAEIGRRDNTVALQAAKDARETKLQIVAQLAGSGALYGLVAGMVAKLNEPTTVDSFFNHPYLGFFILCANILVWALIAEEKSAKSD